MIKYGLTTENWNLIVSKAKIKNDGVYKFRGVYYLVKDSRVTHFVTSGQLLQACGFFTTYLGDCNSYEATKILKSISAR